MPLSTPSNMEAPEMFSLKYLPYQVENCPNRNALPVPAFLRLRDGQEGRGEITLVERNKKIMIKYGGENYKFLPDEGAGDPIYLSPEVAETLGLGLDDALNATLEIRIEQARQHEMDQVLAAVQAEGRYRAAVTNSKGDNMAEVDALFARWIEARQKAGIEGDARYLKLHKSGEGL